MLLCVMMVARFYRWGWAESAITMVSTDTQGVSSMRRFGAILAFVIGAVVGLVGGAALLAYAYQVAGLYPPDDATIKFIAQERGWFEANAEETPAS